MALNLVLLGLGFERESFLLTPWALGLLMAGTSLHFGECIHSEHRIFSSMGFASFSTLKANFFLLLLNLLYLLTKPPTPTLGQIPPPHLDSQGAGEPHASQKTLPGTVYNFLLAT